MAILVSHLTLKRPLTVPLEAEVLSPRIVLAPLTGAT